MSQLVLDDQLDVLKVLPGLGRGISSLYRHPMEGARRLRQWAVKNRDNYP